MLPHFTWLQIKKEELCLSNKAEKFPCAVIVHSVDQGMIEEDLTVWISWLQRLKVSFFTLSKAFFLYLHFANKCQNFQFFVYIGIINTCMHCGNAFVCLYNKFTIYSVIWLHKTAPKSQEIFRKEHASKNCSL